MDTKFSPCFPERTQIGKKRLVENPKKALGALAIGGLGFLGVKALTGGGGNKEQDVVTKLDSVLKDVELRNKL